MKKWKIDLAHSSIEFSVKHWGVAWVGGRFNDFSGSIEFDPDNLEKLSVEVEIEAISVWTGQEQRDGHLKSADFFDVQNYPTATLKSTDFKKSADSSYQLYGDLTIRGVTKP